LNHIKSKDGLSDSRRIHIDESIKQLLNKAENEENYTLYESNPNSKRNSFAYVHSDKYIKKVDTQTVDNEKFNIIQSRMYRLKKYLKIKKTFNKSKIRHAGVIYKAMNIYKQNPELKELSIIMRREISELFGSTTDSWNYQLIKRELVESVYPDICELINSKNSTKSKGLDTLNYEEIQRGTFKFWKLQEEYGELGEEIVKKMMEDKGYRVTPMPHVSGFDFKAVNEDEEIKIEVKTVTSLDSYIYMSINELEKAAQYLDEYNLYLVHLIDYKTNKGDVYIINDPVNIFDIDIGKLSDSFSKTMEIFLHNAAIRINKIDFSKLIKL